MPEVIFREWATDDSSSNSHQVATKARPHPNEIQAFFTQCIADINVCMSTNFSDDIKLRVFSVIQDISKVISEYSQVLDLPLVIRAQNGPNSAKVNNYVDQITLYTTEVVVLLNQFTVHAEILMNRSLSLEKYVSCLNSVVKQIELILGKYAITLREFFTIIPYDQAFPQVYRPEVVAPVQPKPSPSVIKEDPALDDFQNKVQMLLDIGKEFTKIDYFWKDLQVSTTYSGRISQAANDVYRAIGVIDQMVDLLDQMSPDVLSGYTDTPADQLRSSYEGMRSNLNILKFLKNHSYGAIYSRMNGFSKQCVSIIRSLRVPYLEQKKTTKSEVIVNSPYDALPTIEYPGFD